MLLYLADRHHSQFNLKERIDMKSLEQKWIDARYLLAMIAYPRRGGSEEGMTIIDAALLIQNRFSREDLELN